MDGGYVCEKRNFPRPSFLIECSSARNSLLPPCTAFPVGQNETGHQYHWQMQLIQKLVSSSSSFSSSFLHCYFVHLFWSANAFVVETLILRSFVIFVFIVLFFVLLYCFIIVLCWFRCCLLLCLTFRCF